MNSSEPSKLLLAASGGDTVKLFDISLEPQNPCLLSYSPSPGLRVNSVKWNHNNLVLASAGEDCKVSLWRKNGQSLWNVPAKNSRGEIVEPSESLSSICFSNKGSRYLCSGGSGQVVRVWDLQNKRCVKLLKGHTDAITGVMYNCKDEHIASISRKGDLLLHNLASGTRAADLKDPNGQVLGALDYSRMSRHLLVMAGDDGSLHLWDTTGRIPKVSWLKQHSAPTSSIGFSPSNDKVIASVGLDMKLYTFDSGSRKPFSCIAYEAPFTSMAFSDDGLTLAAGTSTGQVVFYDVRGKPQPITVLRAYGNSEAVTNLCWQRSKPAMVYENNCTNENVLQAGDVGDSVLMPDPLPSRTSSSHSVTSSVSGSQNPGRSSSPVDLFSFPAGNSASPSEETPLRTTLLTGGAIGRLKPPRLYNFKDDMEVFSPIVEVQPVTPSVDKSWDNHDGQKKDQDRQPSFLFPSRRLGIPENRANDNHSIFDWKSYPSSKQDEASSAFSQLTSTPPSAFTVDSSPITPPEAWGGDRLSDKFSNLHQSINMPSRTLTPFAALSGSKDNLPTDRSTNSFTPGLSLSNLHIREPLIKGTNSLASSEAVSSPFSTEQMDTLGPNLSFPRRFSSYAERISATPSLSISSSFSAGSPKSKKTGAETKDGLVNNLLPRSEMPSATGIGAIATKNGGIANSERTPDLHQGTSFSLQLFQRTLEETLSTFEKSTHEDLRNLHIEVLRQFHLQEIETSNAMRTILENQAEIMKELESIREDTKHFRRLL